MGSKRQCMGAWALRWTVLEVVPVDPTIAVEVHFGVMSLWLGEGIMNATIDLALVRAPHLCSLVDRGVQQLAVPFRMRVGVRVRVRVVSTLAKGMQARSSSDMPPLPFLRFPECMWPLMKL